MSGRCRTTTRSLERVLQDAFRDDQPVDRHRIRLDPARFRRALVEGVPCADAIGWLAKALDAAVDQELSTLARTEPKETRAAFILEPLRPYPFAYAAQDLLLPPAAWRWRSAWAIGRKDPGRVLAWAEQTGRIVRSWSERTASFDPPPDFAWPWLSLALLGSVPVAVAVGNGLRFAGPLAFGALGTAGLLLWAVLLSRGTVPCGGALVVSPAAWLLVSRRVRGDPNLLTVIALVLFTGAILGNGPSLVALPLVSAMAFRAQRLLAGASPGQLEGMRASTALAALSVLLWSCTSKPNETEMAYKPASSTEPTREPSAPPFKDPRRRGPPLRSLSEPLPAPSVPQACLQAPDRAPLAAVYRRRAPDGSTDDFIFFRTGTNVAGEHRNDGVIVYQRLEGDALKTWRYDPRTEKAKLQKSATGTPRLWSEVRSPFPLEQLANRPSGPMSVGPRRCTQVQVARGTLEGAATTLYRLAALDVPESVRIQRKKGEERLTLMGFLSAEPYVKLAETLTSTRTQTP